METRTVDARGLACPLPVVNAKTAADAMTEGGVLTVLVDNETAVQNLCKFAGSRGYEAASFKKAEREFSVTMQVTAGAEAAPAGQEEAGCAPDAVRKGMTVVLSANVMGTGEEQLGKNLMKAFVFALTKQDVLPEHVLCYNSGAYLTCEGSESLADLKTLEAEGVKIITCGTCLDYYGLKEKLAVGTVTNMYDIVTVQEQSTLVIRP